MFHYFWVLLLMIHAGSSVLRKLKSSHNGLSYLSEYLKHVTIRHLHDAVQVMVWCKAEQGEYRVETFLADFGRPRLLVTGSHLDLGDCKLLVDTFLIFLENTDEQVVTQFLASLPRCVLRARFVVVLPERGNPPEHEYKDLEDVFQRFWITEAVNVVAVLPYQGTVSVFTFFPYKESCHLAGSPVIVDQWPKGAAESPPANLFPHLKVTSLHGCVLRFTTVDLAPDVILEPRVSEEMGYCTRQGERAPNFKDSLDGIEVRLVNALAGKMNFSAHFVLPSDGTNWGWVHVDGALSGMLADINSKLSDVGIGHVTYSIPDMAFLEYSTSLMMDCYGWGVPLGAGRQPPAWVTLTTEFSSLTWGLIFIAILLAALTLWTLPKAMPERERQDKELYSTPSSVLCYTCNTLIAAPMWTTPSSQPVRVFMVFWLLYCMVVNVAYQAKIGSIVSVPWRPINIQSLEELMESDLLLKAPGKLKVALQSSEYDPVIGEVMARHHIVPNLTEFVDELRSQRKRNFAYLMYRRSLEFYASRSGWKFHVMSKSCVTSHYTALAVRGGSPLIPRLNVLIQRLIDTGIVNKWGLDFTPRRPRPGSPRSGLSMPHLLGAFMLLALGLLLALITLLIEVYRATPRRRNWRVCSD